ncbi:MAG TPA: cytochrome P450 [Dehalococcoidia bacterium]|nr:cytochrome P450 [Dehalococcoidia bacterium]
MDPPQHTRYRHALEPFFTDDMMETFEPRCRAVATALVRDLLAQGETDAVTEFAEPFTLKSLCLFLGWPIQQWERLLGWTHGNQQAAFLRDRVIARALARIFTAFVHEELEHHREAGATAPHDVTSSLMATTVDGKQLTDEQIVSVVRNWTAGHGTVAAGLGILILHLAKHQDIQQRLRASPSLIAAAVDEILRLDGPLVANHRTTTRDVEIDGRHISQGQRISLMWIAADRDPHAFDDPDRVRLDRDESGNLLFGQGIHDCMGASLARLEMRVALEELLARTRKIELSGTEPPSRGTFPSNGLLLLPLRIS